MKALLSYFLAALSDNSYRQNKVDVYYCRLQLDILSPFRFQEPKNMCDINIFYTWTVADPWLSFVSETMGLR